jgi:hypothetical protein
MDEEMNLSSLESMYTVPEISDTHILNMCNVARQLIHDHIRRLFDFYTTKQQRTDACLNLWNKYKSYHMKMLLDSEPTNEENDSSGVVLLYVFQNELMLCILDHKDLMQIEMVLFEIETFVLDHATNSTFTFLKKESSYNIGKMEIHPRVMFRLQGKYKSILKRINNVGIDFLGTNLQIDFRNYISTTSLRSAYNKPMSFQNKAVHTVISQCLDLFLHLSTKRVQLARNALNSMFDILVREFYHSEIRIWEGIQKIAASYFRMIYGRSVSEWMSQFQIPREYDSMPTMKEINLENGYGYHNRIHEIKNFTTMYYMNIRFEDQKQKQKLKQKMETYFDVMKHNITYVYNASDIHGDPLPRLLTLLQEVTKDESNINNLRHCVAFIQKITNQPYLQITSVFYNQMLYALSELHMVFDVHQYKQHTISKPNLPHPNPSYSWVLQLLNRHRKHNNIVPIESRSTTSEPSILTLSSVLYKTPIYISFTLHKEFYQIPLSYFFRWTRLVHCNILKDHDNHHMIQKWEEYQFQLTKEIVRSIVFLDTKTLDSTDLYVQHKIMKEVIRYKFQPKLFGYFYYTFLRSTRYISYRKEQVESDVEYKRYAVVLTSLTYLAYMDATLRRTFILSDIGSYHDNGNGNVIPFCIDWEPILLPVLEDMSWYFNQINTFTPYSNTNPNDNKKSVVYCFQNMPFSVVCTLFRFLCTYLFASKQGVSIFVKDTFGILTQLFEYSKHSKGKMLYFCCKYSAISWYDQFKKQPRVIEFQNVLKRKNILQKIFQQYINRYDPVEDMYDVPITFFKGNQTTMKDLAQVSREELVNMFGSVVTHDHGSHVNSKRKVETFAKDVFVHIFDNHRVEAMDTQPFRVVLGSRFMSNSLMLTYTKKVSIDQPVEMNLSQEQKPTEAMYKLYPVHLQSKSDMKSWNEDFQPLKGLWFDPLKQVLQSIAPFTDDDSRSVIFSKIQESYDRCSLDSDKVYFSNLQEDWQAMLRGAS